MNVRKSLTFNYIAQIYSALISVLILPFYISRVGAEGFGLMGFFVMLQGWAALLDAGVSGSLSRQASVTKNNGVMFRKFLKQFYIVTTFFLFVAIFIIILGNLSKSYIATSWLNSQLGTHILEVSIVAMIVTLAMRYLMGPFRSGLIGLEKHGILSLITIVFVTLKFPLGLLVLDYYDNSLIHYFIYQVVVSLFELLIISSLFILNSKKIKKLSDNLNVIESEKYTLKSLLSFSLQLSLLSITWVVVTQIDKLVLSKFLELEDYGYYSLAVSISAVIMIFSAPLSQVLMPRLSVFVSQKKEKNYIELYVKSFAGLSIVIISLAVFIALFADKILFIWTANAQITEETYPLIKWLVMGNAIAVLLNFIFLLQYSVGRLKPHLIAYLSYSFLLIPLSILIAFNYKALGAVIFWFVHNLVFFIVWGDMVHTKYFVGVSSYLWWKVLVPCFVISLLYLITLKSLVVFYDNRFIDFIILLFICLSNLTVLFSYFWLLKNRYRQNIDRLQFTSII